MNKKASGRTHPLLAVARNSIRYRLKHGTPWLPEISAYPDIDTTPRATFVTLTRNGQLRGCIGTTEAADPLVISIARNAYAAAFHDPRFPAVTMAEYRELRISLSLLTAPERLVYRTEAELLAQLCPGRDGLIIEHGRQRATFLPSVWDNLSSVEDFLLALKRKAGLPECIMPESAWRYLSESVTE